MPGRALFVALLGALLLATPAATAPVGAVAGHIVDGDSGQPVGWAAVVVEGFERGAQTDAEGYFLLEALPAGALTLQAMRVGYHPARFRLRVEPGDTLHVDLRMGLETLHADTTVVHAGHGPALQPLEEPEVVFSGSKLRQSLGRTLAETIDYEPGIAQRSMGPAPARPMLRGLSGDRLLVLEDGERTGDLSASSSDHAVAIEPLTARRIEVVRGPRTLLYGSNALGGVVNVVRGAVPSRLPTSPSFALSWQGESVNEGLSGGLEAEYPLGTLAIRLDGSLRHANDLATPRGLLPNTDIRTGNAALGTSIVRPWGHIGVSGSLYDSEYGIPPDPLGGHPAGVSINLNRRHLETRGEFLPDFPMVNLLEAHHTFSRYHHAEFEANGALGLEFGVLTHNTAVTAHTRPLGPLENGAFGLWYEYRNYAAAGLNFSPASTENAGAAFVYQEWHGGPWALNAAARIDARRVQPRNERISNVVGHIRQRDFIGISGGLSVQYDPMPQLTLGATVLRTFRAPGVEELFAEGPHLAAYTYEVGNGALRAERGLGLELFADYHRGDGHLHLAIFRNAIDGFIFPQNTGKRSLRRADLFLYRMVGERALMHGAEASFEWDIGNKWRATGTLSHVRGSLPRHDDEPLPLMPPLQGRLGLALAPAAGLELGFDLRLAAAQNRVGRFETPTDGYIVADLGAQYHAHWNGRLHTLDLKLENLADITYHRHLNRVKDILPEPGRSARLLHKIFF